MAPWPNAWGLTPEAATKTCLPVPPWASSTPTSTTACCWPTRKAPGGSMAYWQIGAAGLVSLALTWVMLAAARRHHFVDTPNTRSSHHRPTPRGGGLAFALVISAGLGWLAWHGPAPLSAALTVLALGGLLIALCGLVDDLRGLGALPRLVLQLAAAAALVYSLPS